jgi:hypothetical protein
MHASKKSVTPLDLSCLPPAPPLIALPLWPSGHGGVVDLGLLITVEILVLPQAASDLQLNGMGPETDETPISLSVLRSSPIGQEFSSFSDPLWEWLTHMTHFPLSHVIYGSVLIQLHAYKENED